MSEGLLQLPVEGFLGALASRHVDAAAGGAAAAVTAAAAAALTSKVARASRATWIDAGGAVAEAETLRLQAQALVDRDADAYRKAMRMIDRVQPQRSAAGGPAGPGAGPLPADEREHVFEETLGRAAEVPLAIAELASEIAALAAEVAVRCAPATRPDAVIAATLAESGAASAGLLVRINRLMAADDPRRDRANRAVRASTMARRRSIEALT